MKFNEPKVIWSGTLRIVQVASGDDWDPYEFVVEQMTKDATGQEAWVPCPKHREIAIEFALSALSKTILAGDK